MTTTSRSELRRWARLALVVALLAPAPACSSCSDEPEPLVTAKPVDLTPVPAPAGLLADVYVNEPGRTWKASRDLVGGPANLMPATFPMLAGTLLGLPAAASGLIDAEVPVVAALVDGGGEPAELAWVVALHVRSGKELVAQLTTGNSPPFSKKQHEKSGVTELVRKGGGSEQDVALGVVGSYLVTAQSAEQLTKLGPYAARTLPKREPPKEPIVVQMNHTALKGRVAKRIRDGWQSARGELEKQSQRTQTEQKRKADFAEPAYALKGVDSLVGTLIDVLASSESARLVAEPKAERLEVHAELTPKKSGAAREWIDEMAVGSPEPLLGLPDDLVVGVVSYSTPGARKASAESVVSTVRGLFGDRLTRADEKRLRAAMSDLAAGRGDELSWGVALGEVNSLVVRSTVSDGGAFASGIRGAFDLLKIRAVQDPLREYVGKVSVKQSQASVDGTSGEAGRIAIDVKAKAPAKGKLQIEPPPVEVLWLVGDDRAYLAAAREPKPVLEQLMAAASKGTHSLAKQRELSLGLARFGEQTSVVLYAEPLRLTLGRAPAGASAPILLGLGRSKSGAWVRLEAAKPVVAALARSMLSR